MINYILYPASCESIVVIVRTKEKDTNVEDYERYIVCRLTWFTDNSVSHVLGFVVHSEVT